jgi:DNA polymerase III epsilon subunit-like protein
MPKSRPAKRQSRRRPERLAVVFDTETTGLISNRSLPLARQPEVIEFYGCLADLATGEIRAEVDRLIRPSFPISERIVEITGITDEMVADAPRFADVADEIFSFLERAPWIIAHNASYDREICEIEAERLGRRIAWPELTCTVEATVFLTGTRLSLTGLHEYLFNEPFKGAHRGREDVGALLRCAVELTKRGEL